MSARRPAQTLPTALVVIPTYNEAMNIASLIPQVLMQDRRLEVLVVDDGSPDGTAAAVKALAKQAKGRVHLMQRGAKLGLGTAYVQGFQWGLDRGYRRLLQMDADFSHDPKALPGFLAALDKADLVVGTRYLNGNISVVNWPLRRLVLSMGASWYVRLVTRLPLSDCTGGFKAWNAEALKAIGMATVASGGYSFQIEMNYRAWKKGFRLAEIPIIFNDRTSGSSKMAAGTTVFSTLWRVWTLRLGF
jgi:dolichol-phosphate mannosyltransferase